ncbi:Glycosylphosphatidylinositol anchor biosynthesis protein 11 [Fulvia fulva]|uniref:Glycosylphosphatidylinositol anchor biosynthesis protein 11 n=1 Tax=Passalora fulva TaxID=5499 RepID=A0A9Q8L858_PASFU|nr:Glycosylphosphatidylinositol anchor biosynthesis protein 11 [Fulvia fulva]KAK4634508.1 Glycosylphosphatidylinositol anchor biosynthesis protein 11 [Fulvia fulva]KAK4638545.1 Glycosylphosphatidylinositol anchor biosynthesis protein 11 [Fulvia fulva]UJO12604.1 Glycosylphosphatidylinositol anchor biosynthesis protein 11 [Fulvia fulva]WPV08659.1 Glycosylphosphatidylinositol anchor biosynthesis protein 11 [Fulvia fulva]WPV23472.1 Glycosylphosphatidylinositol anchor biosynthesis protein 11 [Fulvi
MSSPAVQAKPAEAVKPGKAVDLLPGQLSWLYANLHPVLLLSLIPVTFTTLVRDPVSALLGLAPTVALVQALYCVLCLPSSGQAPSPKSKPGLKTTTGKPAQDIWAKAVPAFLSFVLTFTLSAPLLYIIVILFGAPLVSHHLHTLLLAIHLALLTTPHLFYVHGLQVSTWTRLVSLQQPVDEVYGMALGACVGAWIGTIPIPLDWDREWQKWPITIICGLYAGAVIGKVVGGLLKGSKMKMS